MIADTCCSVPACTLAWLTLFAEENGFHKGREAVKYVDIVVFSQYIGCLLMCITSIVDYILDLL